jgi:hypothetical protein
MCCERLVCASCAGMVVDAGCAACRSSKAHVHAGGTAVPAVQLLALLTFLLLALAVLSSLS